MKSKSPIKILIVDDSVVIQKLLRNFISSQPDFQIIAACSDPFQASQILTEHDVDCMILDLELPKMDGLTFLKKINKTINVKTIVLTGILNDNPSLKDKLIEAGAMTALPKPIGQNNESFFQTLFSYIRNIEVSQKSSDELFNYKSETLLIAASTGSTENVRKILTQLSRPMTTIIVQHMGADYTAKYAQSLNLLTPFEVKEASNSLPIHNNTAYIAPGNFHLKIVSTSKNYLFELNQDPHRHGVRPAADFTFLNLPIELAKKATVVVLSGMGKDGAAGLAHLKKQGARTIAESEKTSTVFGMPKAAIETGCVDHVLDFNDIVDLLSEPNKIVKAS